MNLFDVRTVTLSYSISNLACMIFIFYLWKQNSFRFKGLGYWLADFVLQFIALVLITLRGLIPFLLSTTGSNVMIIGGTLLLYIGLEQFTEKQSPQIHNYILLVGLTITHAFFVISSPDLTARDVLFSFALLVLCAQCAWLMLRRVDRSMRQVTSYPGYVFALFCAVSVARIYLELSVPVGNDFFNTNVYEGVLLLIYQMLFIVLTFSLFLVVNRRLVTSLEKDIKVRNETELALRLSEEKFSKAFQSSPDAVLITRMKDGRFIEVNDGFCHLTGYTREEALSTSSIAIGLWEDIHDREKIVQNLQGNLRVRDFESKFKTHSGTILNIIYSGEVINLGGEECILSVIQDISERKWMEATFRLRLTLWEYSSNHTADELMVKALDEIEVLTGSTISFYHAVESEHGQLTLLAWSTKTRKKFCKVEENERHSTIDEAGVWADCIRQRRPVIHNDYTSLPHRKGLPPGHAAIVRELGVPTMRDGQVVAILAVGNKATNYDERDIEQVTYVADVVWTIVAQKWADAEIHKLNGRLEHLAMTDELTGLINRRSFFIHGNTEIKRAQRYHTPISLIMLDIDTFKKVNDTYGHNAGDQVLRGFAKILRGKTREVDVVARLGGDEFGILLPNTNPEDATILADRLRQAIEEEKYSAKGHSLGVTASIGVASYNDATQNLDALLSNADAAMYQAKNQGRNRVILLDRPYDS